MVKYNTLPEGVPESEASRELLKAKGIFDRIFQVEF